MKRSVNLTVPTLLVALVIQAWGTFLTDANICNAQGLMQTSLDTATSELLPAPRSVRQQIREAKEALEQERYSDAVVRLGDLLRRTFNGNSGEITQDYFVRTSPSSEELRNRMIEQRIERLLDDEDDVLDSEGAATILRQVRDMIGRLPDQAFEIYELRYGPLAAKLLQDAQPTRDWEAVEQVRREFFHTKAGYRASYLLAMREWLLGNPLAVSLLLDDVVDLPRATSQLGDEVIWLHAGACWMAGRSLPKPIRVPADWSAAVQGNDFDEAAWESAVRSRFSSMAFTIDPTSVDYAYLGGRPSRSDNSDGQMPLSNARWKVESSGSPRQERLLESETAQLKATGQLPPPSWMPLRVGDQLLMRTTERLLGVDYRTGKRVWQYPWFAPPEAIPTSDDEDSRGRRGEEDPKDILVQRVWNDVPYGQISSDGERVYMIDDLRLVEVERFNPFGMRGMRSVKASKNTLVALDLATEGKLLWRLGSDETTPSRFSEAFFLGPPLPFRGRLYVMAEMAGEIVLVCLDPQDGSELWRQVLVSIESSGITTDPVRRVAGAMPTYHEGLLICPTGAGVTIAIDLIDQTLRWVNRHPRNASFTNNAFRQPADMSMNQLSQRWMTSVAIGDGTNVALTPVESDRMIVVDAVTGENRFHPQPRGKNLYLAGIRFDQYIIVRADRVMAYDVNTGTETWATPVDMMRPGQRVAGRGVFGETSYFLPTTSDELIEIALASGRVLSRRNVRYPLGNLVAVEGDIISQATTTTSVAYGEESLRPQVDRLLEADPEDLFAIVHKAELLLEDNRRAEALTLLGKARELDPDNDDVISLSVEAMLSSLREQHEISQADLDTLRQLIDRPEQQAELFVLQILRQLRSGEGGNGVSQDDLLVGFDLLLELSALMIERPTIATQQALIFPNEARQFTLSAWVTARVAEISDAADEATRDAISEKLLSHLSTRMRPNRMTLDQIVEHFSPLASAVEPLQQNLLKQYQSLGDALATERLTWGIRLPSDEATEMLNTSRLLSLAQVYSLTGWSEDRRHVGEVLQSRIQEPDATPETVAEIATILDEFHVRGVGRIPPEMWPREVDLQWQSSRLPQTQPLVSDRRYARTTRLMGRRMLGWQAISDNNPLALLDHDGIPRPVPVEGLSNRNSSDKEVTISGGLMLVLTPSELIAIDLFRVSAGGVNEIVRWRQSLHPDGQPVAKRRSETSKFGDQVYRYVSNSPTANADDAQLRLGPVLGDRLFLLQGEDLVCYHCVTGEQLWRSRTGLPGSGVVVGDGRVGVLSERADAVAYFDWFDGSLLESKKMPIDSVIATLGSHALLVSKYDDAEGVVDLYDPHMVEIVNCVSMERVQSRVASPVNLTDQARSAAYGELVNGRYFVLLDDVGRTTIWDVLSGRELADVAVPIRPNLFGLSVVQVKDRFLLMPRCRLPQPTVSTTSTVTVASGLSVQGATSVHCIEWQDASEDDFVAEAEATASDMEESEQDEGEGEGDEAAATQQDTATTQARLAWSVPFDEPRGVTTYQPWLTPMLLLVRGHSHFESTASRRRELDVWGLDIEDGHVLYELLGKNIGSRNNRIETHVKLLPHRDQIIATIQSELLTFTFSDEAAAEDPAESP
ncbi:outer membrane protein assembly factor BamB family protein [Aporhodopirellula aestuarii]|uniref:PQQ-binding-like beta-propeller repeat protein n=1 Tax=Aporhodopirellula aestuarii TaxID=2950107 RepID=A0ABT0U3Z4_9BACT|nr:PQQ-binding-like beta-propeller repeat protein [Aporhodopirellula aestuarii]MCM2371153.1 PQQ-binding-like beta-propeller repeat protein [Aporhodopirellula aestuarii]